MRTGNRNPKPRSTSADPGIAARGQLVYADLGCAQCHTQQVRRPDFGSDQERGWGERIVKNLAIRLDPLRSVWRAARLLGGTFAAICRKAGDAPVASRKSLDQFETLLRCPDCHGVLTRGGSDTLRCASCGYQAPNEGGVYNLLASRDRVELYPGDRADVIDFCRTELADYKRPRKVTFLPELPRNPTGKVLKRELRELQ